MEELGLEHILNPNQLRKKWNYLVAKYKVTGVQMDFNYEIKYVQM